ncbi:MAG: AraC family transcriptional regulator [Chloroflexota bacterium]
MRQTKEQRRFWHNTELDVGLMHAYQVDYAYPRHSHDQYVVCLIEEGVQSFTHNGTKHVTPPSGLILINPGVVHTGESASEGGFRMRSLYPSLDHMQLVASELTGASQGVPSFSEVRIDDSAVAKSIFALHNALIQKASPLECESRFITTLAELVHRYADIGSEKKALGNEHRAVLLARSYMEERFCESITLSDLAEYVALSPYYLLRVFRAEVGMPPHAFLLDVRIRRAQQLIERGRPLVDVAYDVGFSSQSHLTRRFKQIVGVTPGQYAAQVQVNCNRGTQQEVQR